MYKEKLRHLLEKKNFVFEMQLEEREKGDPRIYAQGPGQT